MLFVLFFCCFHILLRYQILPSLLETKLKALLSECIFKTDILRRNDDCKNMLPYATCAGLRYLCTDETVGNDIFSMCCQTCSGNKRASLKMKGNNYCLYAINTPNIDKKYRKVSSGVDRLC